MEAIGFCHPVYDLLEEMGFDVSLAYPLKTRLIGEAKIKTDKIDALVLETRMGVCSRTLWNGRFMLNALFLGVERETYILQ